MAHKSGRSNVVSSDLTRTSSFGNRGIEPPRRQEQPREEEKNPERTKNGNKSWLFPLSSLFFLLCELGVLAVQFFGFESTGGARLRLDPPYMII
jgi:hypothetical protein